MPAIDFLDYVEKNLNNALDLFKGENAFFGAAVGSVIEFLGRCATSVDGNSKGEQDFKAFVRMYLSKQDFRYDMHWQFLYQDLRNGSAHTTLSNGGVRLSVDPADAQFHLQFFKWESEKSASNLSLFIYSPKLTSDLKKSIDLFCKDFKESLKVQESSKKTLDSIERQGQGLIKKHYPKLYEKKMET